MNKKIGIALFISAAVVMIAIPTSADTKTPITEQSYVEFQTACTNSCIERSNVNGKELYCACFCVQATMNARSVVSKYSLKYEEEMAPHTAEMMPDASVVAICKSKAGIK